MRFAHLKTHHGFERMRLRGLSGARDEFHLAAIVQNLKTMALRLLGPPHAQHLRRSINGRLLRVLGQLPERAGHRTKPKLPLAARTSMTTGFFDSISQKPVLGGFLGGLPLCVE